MVLGKTHAKNAKTAPREDQKVIQKAMNLFFLLFLLVGFVLGGGAAVLYYFDINSFLKELKTLEFHSLELQGQPSMRNSTTSPAMSCSLPSKTS